MPETIQTKHCPKCKCILPRSEFHNNSKTYDSLGVWCKICLRIARKVRRHTKTGQKKRRQEYEKYRQTEKMKLTQCRNYYKQRLKYPAKIKARAAIHNSIIGGRLAAPTNFKCHNCPNQAQEYHHYLGYSPEHWFDVVPICKCCHRKIHIPLYPPLSICINLTSVSGSIPPCPPANGPIPCPPIIPIGAPGCLCGLPIPSIPPKL